MTSEVKPDSQWLSRSSGASAGPRLGSQLNDSTVGNVYGVSWVYSKPLTSHGASVAAVALLDHHDEALAGADHLAERRPRLAADRLVDQRQQPGGLDVGGDQAGVDVVLDEQRDDLVGVGRHPAAQLSPSVSRNGVEPVSHSPWHMNRASARGLPATESAIRGGVDDLGPSSASATASASS